jgi:hypothetical protein
MGFRYRARGGRWLGAVVLVAWDLLAVGLAILLLWRGDTDTAVGWSLVVGIFLCLTLLFFRRASRVAKTENQQPASNLAGPASAAGDLVEVMRSPDAVTVEVMRGKLAAHGIAAQIAGQHASRMLGYLPLVPLRLMVPRADAPLALDIMAGKGAN